MLRRKQAVVLEVFAYPIMHYSILNKIVFSLAYMIPHWWW